MKIIGVCCSAQRKKTTWYALEACLKAITEDYPQISTVTIDLAEKEVGTCKALNHCTKKLTCGQKDDFNELIPVLSDPQVGGLIVASPVYMGAMSGQCKAFLDRCVMFRRNGFLFRNKVGGAIAVGGFRNGGQEAVIQSIHAVMLVQDMIVVGDGKPGAHFGGTVWGGYPEGVDHDEVGLETARNLGRRVAEVALKMAG